MTVFGVAHTPIGRVLSICEAEIGRDKVQILAGRDLPANRRCYVVLGVSVLDKFRAAQLERCRATIIIIDSLPALRRIKNLKILDAPAVGESWHPTTLRNTALIKALRADPKYSKIQLQADDTIARLITEASSRSMLNTVLAAARALKPEERAALHSAVARCVTGDISIATLQKRFLNGRDATVASVDALLAALKSPIAKRLGGAIKDHRFGTDAVVAATKHGVDPFEVRFLTSHLAPSGKKLKPNRSLSRPQSAKKGLHGAARKLEKKNETRRSNRSVARVVRDFGLRKRPRSR